MSNYKMHAKLNNVCMLIFFYGSKLEKDT